jgi:hypothetical protein
MLQGGQFSLNNLLILARKGKIFHYCRGSTDPFLEYPDSKGKLLVGGIYKVREHDGV